MFVYSLNSHQHVSATTAAIFRVVILLQEYKGTNVLCGHSVIIKNYYNLSYNYISNINRGLKWVMNTS
jgi:hypothetical protein